MSEGVDTSENPSPEDVSKGWQRQPIVSVLGHVDHGKTSVLDHFRSLGSERQASVMDREAGGITQHIGATEVPADILNQTCSNLTGGKNFNSPGLLFIDTPGHHSFTSLRSRGGALADIAILVVDIMEGLQPQSIESLRILREKKTPFVIAANKIDRLHGWRTEKGRSFIESWSFQRDDVKQYFEEKYWKLLGEFSEHGFNIERYDKIKDFKSNIALVPCSAKDGEGLQDLLTVTVGLAERFLENRLTDTLGCGEATILEMKDERGLGKTIDVILNRGELHVGDTVTLVGADGPFTTHIKGMFRPKGMSEMRDAGDRWEPTEIAIAACGLKIVAPGLEKVLAGTTLRQTNEADTQKKALVEAQKEATISVDIAEEGVVIKADTIGGLEALAFELNKLETPIRMASIGPINKRDILTAQSAKDPLNQIILGFAVKGNSEVQAKLEGDSAEIKSISADIIYRILEEYEEWKEETANSLAAAERENLVYPGHLLYLKDHTFRNKGPAIVGMRVVGGRVHLGQRIMKMDGTPIGQIKGIRTRASEDVREANHGDEVAMSIMGPTVGRHIEEGDEFYVDVPSTHAKRLRKLELTPSEEEILDQITKLHRETNHFWGR
ncbi:MAG: translation initiation factor IF-2 [Candidatus Poseidoniaceae archaeon]|jgi:translation initiation factor 5B|nr:translation initiation factor IF-2 [Candidatus Poseidoniaceae archaeon]